MPSDAIRGRVYFKNSDALGSERAMNDADTTITGAALKKDDEPPATLQENSRSSRLRPRLRNIGAAIASVAAVGAAIGGLTGYWNAWNWKVVRTEIFHENQSLQQNAASRRMSFPGSR